MSEKQVISPPLPWKTRFSLSAASALTDFAIRPNGSLNRFLRFFDFKAPPNPNPIHGVKSLDVTVDPLRNLWFRLFIPTVAKPDVKMPVILFFHGGGFAFLAADSKAYDGVCRSFAWRANAVVVSVNYRLAPENKFPAPYEDGVDVLKFLDGNVSDLLPDNADVSRCFVAGDSAGANIAHHVALKFAADASKFKKARIVGLVSIQPFFGGEERTTSEIRLEGAPLVSMNRTDWMWKAFLPVGSNRDHESVNVSGPNSLDISAMDNFPRTIVFVGGYDPLIDWQKRYYNWLKKSGKEAEIVEYPNSVHAFYIFPELSESSHLVDKVRDFIINTK